MGTLTVWEAGGVTGGVDCSRRDRRERPLDEKLYLETFAVPAAPERGRVSGSAGRATSTVPQNA